MKYRTLRGTRDISGVEAEKIAGAVEISRKIFRAFNYSEVILPVMEETALFSRSAGETSDIVEKQMYSFVDKGGRNVSLRPEGTAGAARFYIQSGADAAAPVTKIFYAGPMFRYERPQEGRYREFSQIGCEYFGNPEPMCDAEIISLAGRILDRCGVADKTVLINSLGCTDCRTAYAREIEKFAAAAASELCEDCNRRLAKNPLRILDCKIDAAKTAAFPRSENFLCDDCRKRYAEVKKLLDTFGIAYKEEPRLVRGLDYYTGTVFEIISGRLGAQNALAAGGRYDNLVEELGGKPTPAMGFALGAERLAMASADNGRAETTGVFVATTPELAAEAAKFADTLREADVRAEGPFAAKSLKSQLNSANRMGFAKVVIFAEDEYARGEVVVKNMEDGKQTSEKIETLTATLAKSAANGASNAGNRDRNGDKK